MKESLIKPYEGKFSAILLFGPPGSGKGVLGRFLAGAESQYYLSSLDIFRGLPSYSPAGKLYFSYASKGQLLPDEVAIEIWKHYVQGLIATNSFYPESQDLLLDGIPRTLEQAKMLSEYVNVRHIIVLNASNTKELMRRIQKEARLKGQMEEISTEVMQARLENYESSINEILAYYPKHIISHVNAEQRPLEVVRDVLVRLSHLLSRKLPEIKPT